MTEGTAIGRKMRTERKTGTSELLFPLRGKKIWGEKKRVEEPVHNRFTLLDERKILKEEE